MTFSHLSWPPLASFSAYQCCSQTKEPENEDNLPDEVSWGQTAVGPLSLYLEFVSLTAVHGVLTYIDLAVH